MVAPSTLIASLRIETCDENDKQQRKPMEFPCRTGHVQQAVLRPTWNDDDANVPYVCTIEITWSDGAMPLRKRIILPKTAVPKFDNNVADTHALRFVPPDDMEKKVWVQLGSENRTRRVVQLRFSKTLAKHEIDFTHGSINYYVIDKLSYSSHSHVSLNN